MLMLMVYLVQVIRYLEKYVILARIRSNWNLLEGYCFRLSLSFIHLVQFQSTCEETCTLIFLVFVWTATDTLGIEITFLLIIWLLLLLLGPLTEATQIQCLQYIVLNVLLFQLKFCLLANHL